jgi:hypothetical protein
MIGSLHGMGADQILSIQLVTTDGSFITASPSSNTDIFWAIRGGGGSTFGVVTSMVIKAFEDIQTTATTLSWGVQENNITADTFWKGISSYFSYFENFTDYGTSAEWFLLGSTDPTNTNTPAIFFPGLIAPGKSLEETQAIFNPWISDMTALGINLSLNWTYYSSYHTAYYVYFPTISQFLEPYNGGYSSRLVPRENFDKNKKLNLTVEVYRDLAEGGYFMNGYHYAPTLAAGKPVGPDNPPNAVNPAWRNALSHTIAFVTWPQNATVAQQLEIRENFANVVMKPMRDATPGAGSYMNEGDILEPDWQQSFYGANYERLLGIKRKYDPGDVFWAITAVGSEGWAVRNVDGLPTENGPLCQVG